MAHATKIVETKSVTSDASAILVRCCDDPTTDSWHTIHWIDNKSDAEITAEVQDHATRVASRHAGKALGDTVLAGLIGQETEQTDQMLAAANNALPAAYRRPPSEARPADAVPNPTPVTP